MPLHTEWVRRLRCFSYIYHIHTYLPHHVLRDVLVVFLIRNVVLPTYGEEKAQYKGSYKPDAVFGIAPGVSTYLYHDHPPILLECACVVR